MQWQQLRSGHCSPRQLGEVESEALEQPERRAQEDVAVVDEALGAAVAVAADRAAGKAVCAVGVTIQATLASIGQLSASQSQLLQRGAKVKDEVRVPS